MNRERQLLIAFIALVVVHGVLMAIALRAVSEPRVSFPLSTRPTATAHP